MQKTKIIIAGIGGVGGFFGGLLARHFYKDENVEIIFIARGKHLAKIQENGLKVIQGEMEFIARPNIVTENPSETGIADLILICTKTYDLDTVMQQLKPCINKDTILLPLLNGVDSQEKIKTIFPDNLVLNGCVYIISRLKEPGVIENSGNVQKLYFGLDNFSSERLLFFEKLFKEANIEATLSTDISTIIWEKFIFISVVATATSFYDKSIGEILSDKESLETTKGLIEEVIQVVKANQINIPEDISEKTLNKIKSMLPEKTSSMHADFKKNKAQNELASLTGYVESLGQKYNLPTPNYSKANESLKKRN